MTILFAGCPYDDAMIEEAKKYIADNGYTRDQVKLCKSGECVVVYARG